MITFSNWHLQADAQILAMQYDNKACTLSVSGEFPEGWTWEMLLAAGDALDVIPLSSSESEVSAVLTAEQLSRSGLSPAASRFIEHARRYAQTLK